ncbi:MAG: hypothetical protein ACW98Y_19190 [Candidatus Thorarchaeota archaeon]|jgi:hypothetical protein
MGRKIRYPPALRRYAKKSQLHEKLGSIFMLLSDDAQGVVDWASEEAKRMKSDGHEQELGGILFSLIAREAAITLVQNNHSRGRMTTKSEIRKKTGLKVEMPVLYRDAGLRHPQEARNLRHNIFHHAFLALITHLFPKVTTSVPPTGEGLTPDLLVHSEKPKWTISVEYKGYRSITLLSESELLKGMRYQEAYRTAWLVTTTTKSVKDVYGSKLNSEDVIEKGLTRLRRITKRSFYTEEQRENRGIAKKGITHLEKMKGHNLTCDFIDAEALLESCRAGKPLKGLSITTGFEFVDMLKKAGFHEHAEDVTRIMKTPTHSLYSDKVTSVRLIG